MTAGDLEMGSASSIAESVVNAVVAGARYGPDWERVSVVTAHWVYAGTKHETREMQRLGLGS